MSKKSNPPALVTVNIQDRLLSQDRWIVALILFGMIAFGVMMYETHQLNEIYKKESLQLELQAVS